jgi:arylsulfatase
MKRGVQSGKPFYTYIAFTLVHFPTLPNPKFAGKTGFGDFPDALAEMDFHVGEILDAIDELKIRDNTIVVFTSDNGPKQCGHGRDHPDHGVVITSHIWKVH